MGENETTKFAKDFIDKNGFVPKNEPPVAFFMAGLPGVGKTEFSIELKNVLSCKTIRLDMDEIAEEIEGYTPEKADDFRGEASKRMNRIFDMVLKKKMDFIMDGTFGSKNAIQNVERAIKRGYVVKIIFLDQDPKKSRYYTKEREKIEHRSISINGFIEAYFSTIDNLRKILSMYDDKALVDVVLKDNWRKSSKKVNRNITLSEFDKIVKNDYTKKSLRKYLND